MKRKFLKRQIMPATDEMDQNGRLLYAVNSAAEILLMSDEDNFENALLRAMEVMANCMKVDRIYIWKNIIKDGRVYYIQQFEWLRDSLQEGKTVRSQEGFFYTESIPEWEKKFLQGECVNGPLRSLSQTERERLEPYGIKSILVTPVYFQDLFWGFVSFDDCQRERTFTANEVSILRSSNLMLASTMHRHETANKMREADEHAKLMLDATPLCCSMWDRNFNIVNCNAEAVSFFGLKDKQEYQRRFFELSPEYQPDGSPSQKKAQEHIALAFREGRTVFEWIHQMLDGTPIPTEVTIVRVRRGDEFIVVGYTRDLREHKKMMQTIEYNDTLLNTVNEVATILLRSETDEFEDNLRRCMGMMAGSVHVDRVYIWKNYKKDQHMYSSQIYEWSGGAKPQQGSKYTVNIPYGKFPIWQQKLSGGQCINGLVCSMPAEEQAYLYPQGILSVLVVPVFLHDQFWGFVGFDDCHHERMFSAEEESILRSASLLIANALLRNEMTHDIQTAVEQAQAASKAKSAFLAHMSHEIRTPMNVIAGMTELVLREDIPALIYEHVLNIKHASSNMLSLISDILDFSKIEAGSLTIVAVEYSLTSLTNDVLNIIRMKVSEKPILFTVNIDCNIPNRLIGDETRIRQILLNVLDNAVKYTAEGLVSLTVSGEIKADTVVLTAKVSDSGVGIRKDDLVMLFDDFMRFEGERHKGVQGTGLGLPITKSLCQAMGGNIAVESEYGVGSTFTITIPQKIKSHDEKYASVAAADTKQVLLYETRAVYAASIVRSLNNLGVPCTLVKNQKEFNKELNRRPYPFVFVPALLSESAGKLIEELKLDTKLVLIVELGEVPATRNVRTISTPVHAATIANILDDIEEDMRYGKDGQEHSHFIAPSACILVVDDLNTNLKVAQGLMLPYQMQIDVCESGETAVELIRKKRYDIIFIDHMMPGMDGIETTNRIRLLEDGSGYYESVPIIALTANAVAGVKEMFMQNGLNDFLAKPIDIGKLHNLLEKWIPEEKKEKFRKKMVSKCSAESGQPREIRIEGVDVQAGIAMTGGAADNYLKTLAAFHADGADKIKKIRDYVEKNDIKLYTVYVHAVKSAAASIGAGKISDLFKALEVAGARNDAQFIHEHTKQALDAFESLLRSIRAVISHNQDSITKENNPVLLRDELLKLRAALDNRDAGEVDDIMTSLRAVKWKRKDADIVKQISTNILLINYTDAVTLLDKLLVSI